MKIKWSLPTLYIYNYHSVNIAVCLVILGLQKISGASYFKALAFIDISINYILYALIILNTALLVKSFFTKTYTSVHESMRDIYQSLSCIILLACKFCMLFLVCLDSLSISDNFTSYLYFPIALLLAGYCFSFLGFVVFGILGIISRVKHVRIQDHWSFAYLDDYQIRSVKTFQEEGKVIGIYCKGFLLNEKDGLVELRGRNLNVNDFVYYIESKGCKINELTEDDIAVMEMLSI